MDKTIIRFLLFLSMTNLVFGQSFLDQYKSLPKTEIDIEISLQLIGQNECLITK